MESIFYNQSKFFHQRWEGGSMKMFQAIIIVLLVAFTADSYARICVGNNCTDSNSVGPVDMRQHNGQTECFGPGCADLGISMPGYGHSSGDESLYPSLSFDGGFDESLPIYFRSIKAEEVKATVPRLKMERKCFRGSDGKKYCYKEVWYKVRFSDDLDLLIQNSHCSENDIRLAIQGKRFSEEDEVKICEMTNLK